MGARDLTMHEHSRFGSLAWVARVLGCSQDWLRDHRERLETAGFPPKDTLTGTWIKADVEAWIEGRRHIRAKRDTVGNRKPEEVNTDGL